MWVAGRQLTGGQVAKREIRARHENGESSSDVGGGEGEHNEVGTRKRLGEEALGCLRRKSGDCDGESLVPHRQAHLKTVSADKDAVVASHQKTLGTEMEKLWAWCMSVTQG